MEEQHCSNRSHNADKTIAEFKTSCAVHLKCVITASVSTQEKIQPLTSTLFSCVIMQAGCTCVLVLAARTRPV